MSKNKNTGTKEYTDGNGGKLIRDFDSDNHIHINKKGKATIFDQKKKKK